MGTAFCPRNQEKYLVPLAQAPCVPCCCGVAELCLFPFLLYQWSPSEKVSLCTTLGACVRQPRLWPSMPQMGATLTSGLGREP